MSHAVLITQCLQKDYIQPIHKYDPLPNALHIGHREALRLVGERIHEGPVNTLMEWAYTIPETQLTIIHIRDWHDDSDESQREHLQQFGNHCLKNTRGAEFIFNDIVDHNRKTEIINASGLNDFVDTNLDKLLNKFAGQKTKVGLVGVWTEAKVSFLAYELRTRYPHFDIAVCSALSAGASAALHHQALERLKNLLSVRVFESVGDFTSFLNGTIPQIEHRFNNRIDTSRFKFSHDTLTEGDKKLLCYLYRDAQEADFIVMDGGFSGNVVMKAKAIDSLGHQQVPTIVKIGRRDLISKERSSFERIEEILGNTAPRIVDYVEDTERGAIKYRYAAMLDEQVTSFQKFYGKTTNLQSVFNILDIVFTKQLGRLYKAGKTEKVNLLKYYDFSSKYAASVRAKVESITGKPATGERLKLTGNVEITNVCTFYEKEIDSYDEFLHTSHAMAYVHGDLNGANIIIDAQHNVWIIDFFHTNYGHILKDLIKFENDLIFIFTKINSEEEFIEAVNFIDTIMDISDLAVVPDPDNEVKFHFPQFNKALSTVKKLRSYYPELIGLDKDPYQYYVAMFRYAMHSLSFDECTDLQKRLALYAGSKCCERIRKYMASSRKLRIDYLICDDHDLKAEGLIGMTILPGRKDRNRSIQEDLDVIRKENISDIICLLSEDEFNEYGVQDLKNTYKQAGFHVLYTRIADQGVPTTGAMDHTLKWLDERIKDNKKVLIHCVGGIGRTGTVVASYLKKYSGLESDEAIEIVRKSRSPRAVENRVQEKFVEEYK